MTSAIICPVFIFSTFILTVHSAFILPYAHEATHISPQPHFEFQYYSPSDFHNIRYELVNPEETVPQPSDMKEQIHFILQEPTRVMTHQESSDSKTLDNNLPFDYVPMQFLSHSQARRLQQKQTNEELINQVKYLSPPGEEQHQEQIHLIQEDAVREEQAKQVDKSDEYPMTGQEEAAATSEIVRYDDAGEAKESSPAVETKVSHAKKEPRVPVFITRDPSKIIALSQMYIEKKLRGVSEESTGKTSATSNVVASTDPDTFEDTIAREETEKPMTTETAETRETTETAEIEEVPSESITTAEQSSPAEATVNTEDAEDAREGSSEEESNKSGKQSIAVVTIGDNEDTKVYSEEIAEPDARIVPEVTKESIRTHDRLTGRQKNYLTKVLEDYLKFIMEFQRQKFNAANENLNGKIQRRSGLFGDLKRNFKSLFMPILTIGNSRNVKFAKPFLPVPSEPLVPVNVMDKK